MWGIAKNTFSFSLYYNILAIDHIENSICLAPINILLI
jgi:hypothetical protein